jgi:hypothetical protein
MSEAGMPASHAVFCAVASALPAFAGKMLLFVDQWEFVLSLSRAQRMRPILRKALDDSRDQIRALLV